ncbi:MAG: Uma2 family endonuclease [Polyangiaceae bacterium]|nr:Uma2 family endonuclease [Polyangiaceae bacterium]
MGQAALKSGLTPEEYLAFERASQEKHEFAGGEIFAMSGGTRAHSLLGVNVTGELRSALLERPCEVHGSDMRVKIAATGSYFYPDASVVCTEGRLDDGSGDTLVNPTVIVEVLSESSEAYDRGEKFAQYRSVPSISDYVLVSQTVARLEHYRRQADGTWLLTILGPGSELVLASLDVRVAVDRVYLKVPLPEPKPAN